MNKGTAFLIVLGLLSVVCVTILVIFWQIITLEKIQFDDDFPSGSVVNPSLDIDGTVRFSLKVDPGVGQERLWFYFSFTAERPIQPWFEIEKTGKVHQANWDIFRPVFSIDGENWVRAKITETGGNWFSKVFSKHPIIRFRPPFKAKQMWLAYSYPYSAVHVESFVNEIKASPYVQASWLGPDQNEASIRRIDISIQDPARSKDVIWVIAREHPGESPSSYVAEGLVRALLETEAGKRLLGDYDVKVIPMINAEGVVEGNYYRNGQGIDLAQDWKTFRSREMSLLRDAMDEDLINNRVALFLNLHSANSPKGHFFLETNESWLNPRLRRLQRSLFNEASMRNAQLQMHTTVPTWDYPVIASNYLNTQYGVYCLYVESNYSLGDDDSQVTPKSLRKLGRDLVETIEKIRPSSLSKVGATSNVL